MRASPGTHPVRRCAMLAVQLPFILLLLVLAQAGAAVPKGPAFPGSQGTKQFQNAWVTPPDVTVATPDAILDYADEPFEKQKRDVEFNRVDKNRFHIQVQGIDKVETEQKSDTLCWAACVQMALAHDRIRSDQTKLGTMFRPDQEDKSANIGVVMRALNPELEPQLDKKLVIPLQIVPFSSDRLVEQLSQSELVIVGLVDEAEGGGGHACIAYGAEFAKTKAGEAKQFLGNNDIVPTFGLYNVSIFDPWPETGPDKGFKTLSGQEFKKQVRFIMSRPLAKQAILDALKGADTAKLASSPEHHTSTGTGTKHDKSSAPSSSSNTGRNKHK